MSYLSREFSDATVDHLERVGVEHVAGIRHEIWDAHIGDERWWVVTNPTNYCSQADFKSRDVVLTFHIGLAIRILSRDRVPITPEAAGILPSVWRRWEQAVETFSKAEQAEDFQAVGTHLRECLISFAHEVADDSIVPQDGQRPKASDVVGWLNLFAGALAPGDSNARLRHYLRALIEPTWSYQQTLLHKKGATRLDAEIGIASVEHLVSCFTAAIMRVRDQRSRCKECDGYVVGGTCPHCGWVDPDFEPAPLPVRSEDEIRAALAEPCVLTSDISTLMTVDDAIDRDTPN